MSIKLENTEVIGWEHAIRGMRNPKNSWNRMDSAPAVDCKKCGVIDREGLCSHKERDCSEFECYEIGPNDHKLMMNLAKGGPVHAKYRRMVVVYVDITAPLYWWKEFDTYKVGTVANSCSTMHKIDAKEFELEDFSHEHIDGQHVCAEVNTETFAAWDVLYLTIKSLNHYREKYLETKDKKYWWQMIQLLPSSYNQKRTVMLNYEVLHNIYISRKDHKLDEWHVLCDWLKSLPYSEIITAEVNDFGGAFFEVCPECGGAGLVNTIDKLLNRVDRCKCPTCNGEKVIRVIPKAKEK